MVIPVFFIALLVVYVIVRIFKFIIGLGYAAAIVVDVLVLGGFAIYYAHHAWFVHIASGKAVYFWDGVLFVAVSFVYAAVLLILTNYFPRLGSLFHYVIAWFGTACIYLFINLVMFEGLGQLLDHDDLNVIVHFILISLFAIIIFKKRKSMFSQQLNSRG